MHYTLHVDLAFVSVEHITHDVNYDYLLRYIHANGSSMFFQVYIHVLEDFIHTLRHCLKEWYPFYGDLVVLNKWDEIELSGTEEVVTHDCVADLH